MWGLFVATNVLKASRGPPFSSLFSPKPIKSVAFADQTVLIPIYFFLHVDYGIDFGNIGFFQILKLTEIQSWFLLCRLFCAKSEPKDIKISRLYFPLTLVIWGTVTTG